MIATYHGVEYEVGETEFKCITPGCTNTYKVNNRYLVECGLYYMTPLRQCQECKNAGIEPPKWYTD